MLMAPSAVVNELNAEIRIIERPIKYLPRHQSDHCSGKQKKVLCASVEPAHSRPPPMVNVAVPLGEPGSTLDLSPSWASVVKGRKRVSLPLYEPFETGADSTRQLHAKLFTLVTSALSSRTF